MIGKTAIALAIIATAGLTALPTLAVFGISNNTPYFVAAGAILFPGGALIMLAEWKAAQT